MQSFKEIGDLIYIYQNEVDKETFQHDIACEDKVWWIWKSSYFNGL